MWATIQTAIATTINPYYVRILNRHTRLITLCEFSFHSHQRPKTIYGQYYWMGMKKSKVCEEPNEYVTHWPLKQMSLPFSTVYISTLQVVLFLQICIYNFLPEILMDASFKMCCCCCFCCCSAALFYSFKGSSIVAH